MSRFLVIAMLILSGLSLGIGAETIDLIKALKGGAESVEAIILREVRLPRTLIALIVGATLGASGAAMQGLLRNPLASPGLIGSASGAALAAVAVLYFGTSMPALQSLPGMGSEGQINLANWVPIAGMLGALLATLCTWWLAGRDATTETLILAGVAVNAFATAAMSLLLNLAPSPYAVQELVLWTLGDLSDRSVPDLLRLLPTTLIGWVLLFGTARSLDALSLGENTAQSMGVDVTALRWRIFIATSLCVGAAVATAGMIGFVGLVVPHLLRASVGHRPGRLLLMSALGGAVLVLAADIAVRLVPTIVPLKIGVLTSLLGAPFFLYLVRVQRRRLL